MLFGPTFVKTVRPVLSVLSVSPVCNVGVLWPNGWIKMKLGVRIGLGPDHIVLGGDPAAPTLKGHSPQIPAHICCGQMAGCIKMPLGMEYASAQATLF